MKRVIKIVLAIVAVLLLTVATIVMATFLGRAELVDGQEFGGIHVIADGFFGMGLIPLDNGQVALVDAGNDPSGAAILAELGRRQLGAEAVTAILLTHGHPDHVAAIPAFPKAEVMALEAEVPLVEGLQGSRGPLTRFFPVRPTGIKVTKPLMDGDEVMLGTTSVRVFAIPGHTPGSAAYLVNGVLFVGDSADVGSDGRLMGAPWIFTDDPDQNRTSLGSLAERLAGEAGVLAVVPAHSGAVRGIDALTEFARTP